MTAKDQLKLIAAGFQIIRREHSSLTIKFKSYRNHEWRTLEKGFASKAALDRKADEWLKLSIVVED